MSSARNAVITLLTWIAGGLFATIFAINIAQIVARQLTGGWIWIGDLTQLLFAWMVMLGAAAAYGRTEHIVADFLVQRLPRLGRVALAYLMRCVELLIGFVIVIAGMRVAATRMSIDYIQLGLPTGWAYYAIPALGAALLLFGLTALPRPQTAPSDGAADTQEGNRNDH